MLDRICNLCPARELVWQQQANLQSGSLQTKRYFTNLYETVNDAAGQEKHLHYLIAPTGVFAIFTAMNDGSSHIQYLLKDHQGSLAEVAGSDGHITESYSFDAFKVKLGFCEPPLTEKSPASQSQNFG